MIKELKEELLGNEVGEKSNDESEKLINTPGKSFTFKILHSK